MQELAVRYGEGIPIAQEDGVAQQDRPPEKAEDPPEVPLQLLGVLHTESHVRVEAAERAPVPDASFGDLNDQGEVAVRWKHGHRAAVIEAFSP